MRNSILIVLSDYIFCVMTITFRDQTLYRTVPPPLLTPVALFADIKSRVVIARQQHLTSGIHDFHPTYGTPESTPPRSNIPYAPETGTRKLVIHRACI